MSKDQSNSISKEAFVHPSARIGPFSFIDSDVVIGEGSWVGPNVTIFKGTRIGSFCKIFPGAVLGAIPQDLKFEDEESTLEIGNHVTIREFCTLNRGTKITNKTVVGDHCLLMAYTHIAHDCVIEDGVVLANNVNLAGHVYIENHAFLCGLVAVQQFVRIGCYSMIAGASLVRKDVPPYIRAAHEPLSFIGVNTIGLKRKGFNQSSISSIKEIYQIVYGSGLKMNDKLNRVKDSNLLNRESEHIISFIESSKSGIIRRGKAISKQS